MDTLTLQWAVRNVADDCFIELSSIQMAVSDVGLPAEVGTCTDSHRDWILSREYSAGSTVKMNRDQLRNIPGSGRVKETHHSESLIF